MSEGTCPGPPPASLLAAASTTRSWEEPPASQSGPCPPPPTVTSARFHCLNPLCSGVPQCLCTVPPSAQTPFSGNTPPLPPRGWPLLSLQDSVGILGNLPRLLRLSQVPPLLGPAFCPWGRHGLVGLWVPQRGPEWAPPVLSLTPSMPPTDACLALTPRWVLRRRQGSEPRRGCPSGAAGPAGSPGAGAECTSPVHTLGV